MKRKDSFQDAFHKIDSDFKATRKGGVKDDSDISNLGGCLVLLACVRMEKLDGAIPSRRRMMMSSGLPRIKSKFILSQSNRNESYLLWAPQLLLFITITINYIMSEHGTSRILSSCTCLHFHRNTTMQKSAARAGPEETSLLYLSQPSPVRCLIDSFNLKLHNSFNNSGSVGITSRMDPTNHQLINNFNLPSQFFPGAADK